MLLSCRVDPRRSRDGRTASGRPDGLRLNTRSRCAAIPTHADEVSRVP